MVLRELVECLPQDQQVAFYVGMKHCGDCKLIAHCFVSELKNKYSEYFDKYKISRIEAARDGSLKIYAMHKDCFQDRLNALVETYSSEEKADIKKIVGFGKSIMEHAEDIVKESRGYPTMTECDISVDMNLTNKDYVPTLTLTRSWIPEAIVNC